MAVKLEELYDRLHPKYGVRLCTDSCFDKTVSWMHILEDIEFVSLLRGGELILKSEYESEEWLKKYVRLLDMANAGGLIVALRPGQTFPREVIDCCNSMEFPLFSSPWKTSYMDIMHLVSSILLESEKKEAGQITALRNAIARPEDTESYQPYFEESEFSGGSGCFVAVLGAGSGDAKSRKGQMDRMKKAIRYAVSGSLICEENGMLVVLAAGYRKKEMKQKLRELCEKEEGICAGVGDSVYRISEISRSFRTADTACRLAGAGVGRCLDYEGLGVYKLLADVREPYIYPAFAEETLGPLFRYDAENQTDYVRILRTYFEHECSGIETAEALYFHKNTMTGKLNKIREILGYDILKNENRTRIMIAFYILRMGKEYFGQQNT